MSEKPEIVKILKQEESSGKLRSSNQNIKPYVCISKHLLGNEKKTEENVIEKDTSSKCLMDDKRTLQTLINLISDPVVVVNKKGRFLEVSDGVEELTGLRREELLGTSFMKTDFITAKSKAVLIKNLAKRLFGSKIDKYEIEAISKNGEILFLEVNGVKIDYDGKPADLVVLHDVSTQRKTEAALKTSESKWRQLVENIPDILMTVNRNGKILSINRAVEGLDAEAVIGKNLSEYESPEYRHIRAKAMEEAFKTGESVTYEILGMGPNGQFTTWYETRILPANHGEQNGTLILMSRDITNRKEAEEALKQSEARFRDISESMGDWIWGVDKDGKYIFASGKVEQILG
ncbi:MAG: PAS domain S-box protein [Candidatus Cloacimonetes bacterium]|nr:PAS domain S-box protein [Candidatus Cloacimonadota bacterium]